MIHSKPSRPERRLEAAVDSWAASTQSLAELEVRLKNDRRVRLVRDLTRLASCMDAPDPQSAALARWFAEVSA